MNFSVLSAAGTHFVTTGGQLPMTKIQQNVSNNGSLSQVVGMVGGVGMGDGVQYVRALDSNSLQSTPQIISIPISLPGSKPGDPQPTVQIQVLSPNILQSQQQPKYQMQIPIQGFQQGMQFLTMPQDMQLAQQTQQDNKEAMQQNMHQVFVTPNHQILISGPDGNKIVNNNTSADNNNSDVTIKEEVVCIEDESSQGTESSETNGWQLKYTSPDLTKYFNSLTPHQMQQLPLPLKQCLGLTPAEDKKADSLEVEVRPMDEDQKDNITEAIVSEDGTIHIQNKKKKKYKKKPAKPARPKPGQVVIANTADGGVIWCCPECNMAFPDKGELEIHLTVHKIERRFICGICGAGLKRKEHLERHKLGHNPERPYVCASCGKGFKRREHLNLHTVIHSGVKTELCGECGKGFYRKDHLRKHMRSHVTRRARDEASGDAEATPTTNAGTVLPEITIHVPTNSNMPMPVQINIPQHVMSSLAAAQAQEGAGAAADAASEAPVTLAGLLSQYS